MRLIQYVLISTLAAAAAGACKSEDKAEPSATKQTEAPAPAPAPKPAGGLTDPQIAAIVVVANQVDVDAGKLALGKSQNQQVKELAERMVTDHTGVNQAAVELVTRLAVTPEETDASKGLAAGGAAKLKELGALDGAAFDRAYVDNEVAYHQAVIGVLDSQIIPSASNAELKKMLVEVRPAFDAHLEHARQVQKALAGAPAAGHAGH
jgi:putative membrane protein